MTDCLRLRSMRTPTWSRLSISNSSQAPRLGMIAGGVDVLVGGLLLAAVEVHAGRADQLRDDDALGAVDDEGALGGHQREVAHEDGLGLDLTGEVVHELGVDVERGGVGLALLLALVDRVLRSSSYGLVNESCIVSPRSSMGEISSKISSRPVWSGRSWRPAAFASATRAFQASLPTSQSKLSVCSASRSGTVRVSVIFANESRDCERPFLGVPF